MAGPHPPPVERRRLHEPQPKRGGVAGIGVDSSGGPVIDPTENVIALVEAESRRQDDLRVAAKELNDTKVDHQKEISDLRSQHQGVLGQLREEHQEKMANAESGRLNSIRQVDREEVAKTAVAANLAITTLAKQTTDLQTTLQKQVADTAVAVEQRQSAAYSDTNKRLSAVELALSEGKGKQQVADPAIERMAAMVERLVASQALGTGKGEGIDSTWKLLIAGVGLLVALNALGVFTRIAPPVAAPQAAPQVIYVPAPPGAMLPTTPPQPTPR
jgi:hypothetical protein